MRAAVLVSLVGFVPLAHAGLGDVVGSSTADRAASFADAVTTTTMGAYDRKDLTTADGGSVREYVTQAAANGGTVFAVTFAGPTMPDLKAVLGAHYDAYLTAARAHRGNHHVLSFVADDGMVMRIVKLQRGFAGQARLPAQMPRGVTLEDLR